ncbi:MAG: hypothetical protein LC798_10990 [Chloroflexi bacterium]|nr:hypothetical protein [Chloroflexota bacterium]
MGADPAGISAGIARAFRNDPDWSVRSLVSMLNYIQYPVDLAWERKKLAEHWGWADVVHLHHNFLSADRMGRVNRKPFVVEFHGSRFREEPSVHLRELQDHKAIGLASTLDLYLIAPDLLTWAPAPVNVEALSAMKQPATERIRIAHAPTNRAVKSTRAFLEATDRLIAEGYPVVVDLIEYRPWAECLERKAKADIFFDQAILGFGCNALEAWGMGIPVVAGAADATLDEYERRFGHLPFYHATQSTIYDALRELVESPELRTRYGDIGLAYVKKFHSEELVVAQLKELYHRALEQHTARKVA